jgi:hypothetical protein
MELFESFMEETAAREIFMEIIEGVRSLESVLGVSRRLLTFEERLGSITGTVIHETEILRTAMEEMAKDLKWIAIVTGMAAGIVTAAIVRFYLL